MPKTGARGMRRAMLMLALATILVGALVAGAGEVRAQTVAYNLTVGTSVVPGGTMVLNVTTPGVTIVGASPPAACPITIAPGGTSATFACGASSVGLPQNTVFQVVFSGTSGAVMGTVTYNANGPYPGSGAVGAPTPIPATSCNFVPASLTSTCSITTTTTVVPGGNLDLTVTGQTSPAQSVQINSTSTPTTVGGTTGCPLSTLTPIPTATAATAMVTYSCGAAQSVPSGTGITVSIGATISGTPTIQASQNSNAPLPALPAIPSSTQLSVTFGTPSPTAPTLTNISPSSGPGGSFVTLTGTGLASVTSVSFGGTAGTGLNCAFSGTSCTVNAPLTPGGITVNVTATSPGGTSNALTFAFTGGPGPGPGPSASVTYQAGWNLLGVPFGAVITGNVTPFYNWNGFSYDQLPGSALQPGLGYWTYFNTPTTVTIPSTPPQTIPVPLPPLTWVMVGNPGSGPATVTGADQVWIYNSATGYQFTNTLPPGSGAWAQSNFGSLAVISVP